MTSATNPMAQAWIQAAADLGILVVHPFTFLDENGASHTTAGVYLPHFGGECGTLLTCRFDADDTGDAVWSSRYHHSALNPHSYEPYRRDAYIETLNDWGWFGPPEAQPSWYTGNPWS